MSVGTSRLKAYKISELYGKSFFLDDTSNNVTGTNDKDTNDLLLM